LIQLVCILAVWKFGALIRAIGSGVGCGFVCSDICGEYPDYAEKGLPNQEAVRGVRQDTRIKTSWKEKPIGKEAEEVVLQAYQKLSPVPLERLIERDYIHIPHNRIHKFLLEEGLAKEEPCSR